VNEEDPLLKGLAENGEILFHHHKKKFSQHVHYTARISEETEEKTTYNVLRDRVEEEDIPKKENCSLERNKIICSCKKCLITGIICRQLFVVAKFR